MPRVSKTQKGNSKTTACDDRGRLLVSKTGLALKIDKNGTSDPVYIGIAAPGSIDGDSVWQIKKLTWTGGLPDITWADSNDNFDNIWTNRDSLSYG